MSFKYLSIVILAFAIPTLCHGATIQKVPVQSRLTGVTVYQDRAQTVRTASLNLKPGTHLIAVEGLPVLLQDDSIRVEGSGTARVTIAGIEVKRKFLEQTSEKRGKELENEMRALERKIGSLDAKRAGIAAQKSFLESIKVAWGDRISKELAIGKPSSAELMDAAGFVGSGIAKAEEQFRDIDAEKRQIKEKIDALKRQKNEVTGSLRKEAKTVEITVDVAKEGNFNLNLSGVVSKATWEPAYDVRLAPDGQTAEITFRALVRQQSGEDWNNVVLTLSTARPSAGGAPPEMNPWRLSLYRPVPPAMVYAAAMPAPAPRAESFRAMKKAARPDNDENLAGSEISEEPAPAEAVFQTAQVSTETTSVSFRIPKPVDVTGDNSQQSSVISIDRVPVTTEYVAVPKLSPSVYLTAELVNKAAWPLLPGQIKIFTGNTFIGTAMMKKVAAGEKYVLPFGSDDQVTVKREEKKQHKEGGMFGSSRMGYLYKVEANNFRKEPQTLTVKDQIPLAGDNEIRVSLEEALLKPTEKKDDGTVLWKLKMAPGEKKEFSYEILVEYPKDRKISGL